ncbi:MAG: beta-ketoacyl-[acyl-carrier-protein] synthase family protein [Nitrospirae bacterium]|uniref:beta-ketoacyl-[acyl-carrier-protein] synthase family protein n=1 Tax=Candidatus Magnetobacterium casense TaxID=1455061 RepID=UPI00058F5FBD|nr:beta-ketoacyl-[acyl-carrier-protein] synthase family protein [Candidatus Magnetobacterium casensis]MBF0336701.1 beta-ketoacyl-[acyl-carrier-protein] synthase family protein [Nitrospirota bacterium]
MRKRRVVITGIGAITPLGNNFRQSWEGLISGKCGLDVVEGIGCGRIAGEQFQWEDYLSEKQLRRLDPFVHYALVAAAMALEDSASDRASINNCAIIMGTSRGGITRLNEALRDINNHKRLSSYLMSGTTSGMAASYIAEVFGSGGYTLGISNACASGANAVGEAYRLVSDGYAEVAISGGSDAPLCDICFMGYEACRALSRSHVSRPFDVKRDGFVLSEGAAVLILEAYDRALGRGAPSYAEIVAHTNSSDGYNQVRPNNTAQARAMLQAINIASLTTGDIDHVNTHGSSTRLGDLSEAMAIREVFKEMAEGLPITANKSATGHMLAASGAFELATAAMTIREGVIPPTINVDEPDPECSINLIREPLRMTVKTVMSNSFGFGGGNAVTILKKYQENV